MARYAERTPPSMRTTLERVRDSQFVIPALCILASLGMVAVTNELDRAGVAHPLALASSASATRTLLATTAGAIITVAALVFSLSAVTMQLAATQYSPRVVQGFLRDRRQQITFGVAMGTFTYTLSALAILPDDATGTRQADWTATVTVVLGVGTALVIVAFIDHMIRRVRIDDTVRQLSQATERAFRPRIEAASAAEEPWSLPEDAESIAGRAPHDGFIQHIDVAALLDALPSKAVARLDVWTGHFVIEGRRMLTAWGADGTGLADALGSVVVGERRTIEQDPAFGIQQLVDIALRALSPGVNDPATAADVVRHLTKCLRAAYLDGRFPRVWVRGDGARLYAPHAPGVDQLVHGALTPIRRASGDHPSVLWSISEAAGALDDELEARGIDGVALRREAAAAARAATAVEEADVIEETRPA